MTDEQTDGRKHAIHTVVIAVDRSDNAEHAFDWYMEHAHSEDHIVYVAHCTPQPIIWAEASVASYNMLLKEARAESKAVKRKYAEKLNKCGKYGKYLCGMDLRPHEWLVDVAHSHRASLLVVGSRGQGGVRRALLGSHSDYVLHHAHCPVAVCHTPPGDGQQQHAPHAASLPHNNLPMTRH